MNPATMLAKEEARAKRESLELAMHQQLRALGLTIGLMREWQFDGKRKWRFDFAYPDPDVLLAIEVEGGTWTGGRHTTGVGFERDAEKYAHAAIKGWRVIRATSDQVKSGVAAGWVEQALGWRAGWMRA